MKIADYIVLANAFTSTGVGFTTCDERETEWAHPIPEKSVKYLAIGVAHLHFDFDGNYLGIECEGDGNFIPRE